MSTTLLLLIGLPLLLSLVVLPLGRQAAGRVALLGPVAVLALGVVLALGGEDRVAWEWLPSVGVPLSFQLDRLGLFFVLLIGGVGLGIFQYARHYLEGAPSVFWAGLLLFVTGMLLIVLADSMVVLLCGWEITTVLSALLIGMEPGKAASRKAALQAFLVTGAGGLALLAGVALLALIGGSWELSVLALRADEVVAHDLHVPALVLLLLAAFTKSAQFPFHFWLPGAMVAPAPISAYLHSATMVKTGIVLLARLLPIFGGAALWRPALLGVGLITLLVSGWNALRATDLKGLLAWSTVATLGTLTAMYGAASSTGTTGFLVVILSHALYKSALFLLVGWLGQVSGARDLDELGPVRWGGFSRVATVGFVVGAWAMAGLPLLLGFVSKEVMLQTLKAEVGPVVLFAVLVGNALVTVQALKLSVPVLTGERQPEPVAEPSRWLVVVPACLLALHVVGGLVPGLVSALEPELHALPVWHTLSDLGWSVAIFALGLGLYTGWARLGALPVPFHVEDLAVKGAEGVVAAASWCSRAFQAGGHARYTGAVLSTAVVVVLGGLAWAAPEQRQQPDWNVETILGLVPAVAILVGAPAAVMLHTRMAKLVLVASVGYGIAILYVLLRAPDLALTQFLSETVGLLMLLLVLRYLPALGPDPRGRLRRLSHAVLATMVGIVMGTLAWLIGAREPTGPVGEAQLAWSRPAAEGNNVVNVILVDFRALDTLGEITVLVIAAVGAVAVLRSLPASWLSRRGRPALMVLPEPPEVKG